MSETVRKPRVIDLNAVLRKVNGEGGNCVAAIDSTAFAEPDVKKYDYNGSSMTAPNVPQPLTEAEKDRLTRRRAEIAEEQRQKESAAAAEALKQRAQAMVEACKPAEDEDEEAVLRRLEALESKLASVGDIMSKRAEGHEDGYQTWVAAERYRKEDEQRAIDVQLRKEAAIAAKIEDERKFRQSLRNLIEGIVDNIDLLYQTELENREVQRIAALDKALQDEANARIRERDDRTAASVAERQAFEKRMFGSNDPMIEEIRKASYERHQAYLKKEAEDEAAEEAALEAKLARLNSRTRL